MDLYTATEARSKLGGVAPEILRRYVDKGSIRKVVPPGNVKRGMYVKEDVDKMAEAMEEFTHIHAILPRNEVFEFSQAKGEKDIKASVQIARQHFGERAYGLEKRMAWYNIVPNGDYVLKHNGVVVAYFSMQNVKPEALERLFYGKKNTSLQIDDIIPLIPDVPLECYVSGIGIKLDADSNRVKRYGRLLLLGLFKALIEMGRERIDIKKIWAMSGSVSGIRLSRDLNFTELDYTNNEQIGFMLDLERSDFPFIEKYREVLREAQQSIVTPQVAGPKNTKH